MFNRQGIADRFFGCFPDATKADIARLLNVSWASVKQWETLKRPVPWSKLRYLVVTQHLSWDWLLEGHEPKLRKSRKPRPENFDTGEINRRFLAYFDGMNRCAIGRALDVTHSAVFSWYSGAKRVPWEKLRRLVVDGSTTWEWLLEGA